MMSWILLIVVLIALVIIGTWAWGSIVGRGTVMEAPDTAVDTNEENLRALEEGRFDDLRFDVVTRGYRQDQVDALLAAVERRMGAAPVASDGSADDSAEPSPAGAATSLPLSAEKELD
ncbi:MULTISPECIES: DivIVA domain-containing protein [unclassified Corynebacterium]|uniref:DivIVA domain-containing protein n=1 Tax=unclassified Corynebacterium TaxID=2624378 RepID=UPI0008A36557|nr:MULTISPECIES: DivIVA domain-containing protein [unclassified Corynebacterium]OFK68766.1 cell division protein DivIVA [Corynebacterium sp. HMSC076G08]OFN33543.1 cell division protein DivIVA [Corynebacterium sp. HMSC072A04]OFO97054.1 cell division protein DivIVA [Corynebacterium sp. HMSC034H07]